jgi:hypothetical protein
MAADPRDRFDGFTGEEHIFLVLDDPLRLIREEIEHELRDQIAGTELDAITMEGEPKLLTTGQRAGDDAMTVQHVGFCLRARLAVHHDGEREELDATLTFLFGHLDRPGQQQLRTYFDLQRDAPRAYEDETFDERFETFRSDLS